MAIRGASVLPLGVTRKTLRHKRLLQCKYTGVGVLKAESTLVSSRDEIVRRTHAHSFELR